MKKEEKVRYLANLYCVAMADGTIERVEERLFDEVSRDIGAGYFERKEAMEMAKKNGLQGDPARRWSDRIGNLEDMLFVACCDNAIDADEKSAIIQYAKRLGISQEQMDLIKGETKERVAVYKKRRL